MLKSTQVSVEMLMDLLWFSYHPLAIKSLEMLLIHEQVLCRLDVYS